ncbi:hypothetical protein LX36DRAFT_655167 [Colletotrichum falcatum]|nr:hypothetical protein LX36DRAFT_655167 [Colletotrichum falcatum]
MWTLSIPVSLLMHVVAFPAIPFRCSSFFPLPTSTPPNNTKGFDAPRDICRQTRPPSLERSSEHLHRLLASSQLCRTSMRPVYRLLTDSPS